MEDADLDGIPCLRERTGRHASQQAGGDKARPYH
jgi:hypothetical protein